MPRSRKSVLAGYLRAGFARRRHHRLDVVDDQPEVTVRVRRLGPALGQREELVTQVDERHPARAAAHRQRPEDSLEKRQRLVDRADLECDVVDA